jgi:hypothetical protein
VNKAGPVYLLDIAELLKQTNLGVHYVGQSLCERLHLLEALPIYQQVRLHENWSKTRVV